MGLVLPNCQQESMTSWQRLSISGFWRCTEAKSKSAELVPVVIEDAAPPPKPISMAGPPSTINWAPASNSGLSTWSSRIFPYPPAIIIGL